MRFLLGFFVLIIVQPLSAQWVKQTVNTNASFRGLSVVNEKIVWASGTDGTVIRTIDSGKTWKVIQVPGAEKLDFRDIEAFDANTAYILSIGNGESSRIYKTTDGGKSWAEQFRNNNEKAFFDAMACWSSRHCIAVSDPVNHRFVLIRTDDGGVHWAPIDTSKMPKAKEGEAAFAASGTCLMVAGSNDRELIMIATGGASARVFRFIHAMEDFSIWTVSDSSLTAGDSGSGIFSMAMLDRQHWIIVGGNYERPEESKNNIAFTSDTGQTWRLASGLSGYRSGVTYVDAKTIVAVGTNGTDRSRNGGKSWKKIGDENLNAVAAKGGQSDQKAWSLK